MNSKVVNPAYMPWLTLASAVNIASGKWFKVFSELSLTAEEVVKAYNEGQVSHPIVASLCESINPTLIKQAEQWLSKAPCHHIISYQSRAYPERLKNLHNPPLVLFVHGNPALLNRPQLAIVGSRRASHQGKHIASEFAAQLARNQVVVISGLAAGIDAAAHIGGLTEIGGTIAVMGTGPDTIYPPANRSLYHDIIRQQGACITEFFPGVSAKAWHFPRRNRIIAAMSLGTLVIEAKIKSGTLITANLAADMGREVFAVPGSISHAYSEGCHWLIQQGAKLVTCVDDIFEEIVVQPCLYADKEREISEKSEVINLATDKLLDSVDYDITAIDVIAQRSAMPVQQVMVELLEYELRGLVAAIPGGYVKLRGK